MRMSQGRNSSGSRYNGKIQKTAETIQNGPRCFLHSLTISVWNTAAQKVKNCKARIIPPSRFWPKSGAYQYRSPPTKAALLREPYDLTQIVRNESARFQDFALCAKCLCAALAASQRGCIRFGNGFIPPSRFWPNSGAYQYRSRAGEPHNRQRAARAPRPKRAAPPGGSPAQL